MHTYNSLSREFVKAIQTGQVARFIDDLNDILQEEPRSYLIWLFVARAYDAVGDVDNAYHSYEFVLRLADPKQSNEDLLKELQGFVDKNGGSDLLRIATERLGYRPSLEPAAAQPLPDPFATLPPGSRIKSFTAASKISRAEANIPPVPVETRPHEDNSLDELVVSLPDEGIDLISPMLRRDLANVEFRDEKIVLQGNKPDVADASRLLKKAEQAVGYEFGECFPFFLEAAKAYNELPEDTYRIADFFRALTQYAMLKGSAFVSDMAQQILSGQPTLSKLRCLRDNAASYYLEALALQVRVDPSYVLIPLANYLRAQIFYKLISRNERIPDDVFKQKFAELFKFCLTHTDEEIERIAYQSVISWGAASTNVWNRIQSSPGGPGRYIGMSFEHTRRERSYRLISEITGRDYNVAQEPSQVLQSAFFERRRQLSEIHNFLFRVQQITLSKETIRELDSLWQSFPNYRSALFDTDVDIKQQIGAILTILLPYNDRSGEERTSILFSARTEIENLLRFIRDTPTFWGRVVFEPLLTRWQAAIKEIEKGRLTEILPKIVVRLEPPLFRIEGDSIEGGFILSNVGRGTAEGVKVHLQLSSYDTKEIICELEDEVNDEIRAIDGTYHYLIRIDKSDLSEGTDVPYRLRVDVAPIFARAALDSTVQEFTLEIGSDARFSRSDIPWNEVSVPPEHLFLGREEFIHGLVEHLKSTERSKTHILYGLTRTGKTSILRYLKKQLDLQPLTVGGESFRFVSFEWQIENAATQTNASDMWNYLLGGQTVFTLEKLARDGLLTKQEVPRFRHPDNVRFRDWDDILTHLQRHHIYPVFLFDEFSFYKAMFDRQMINASFLAAIRSFAIEGKASFLFFGTYDLKEIITNPRYGITGQFVNAIEVQVSRISRHPAIKLIEAMGSKLVFTRDAIEHILHLSYQMPYFIQLLCKHCAIYAFNTGRSFVGFPEVETVVRVLAGEEVDQDVGCPPLSAVAFQNNMYTQQGPMSFNAVLSTIAELTRGQIHPRMVTYAEIQEVWARHGVRQFQARLADAITELTDREILVMDEDESEFAYRISVDLFRRWWSNNHRNLKLQLDRLKEQE